MNHLLMSDYHERWKNKTKKELMELQDTLVNKINITKGSPSVDKSLTEILFLLEKYMENRGIFEKN